MINRLPGVLIFEDDVQLSAGFAETFRRIIPPPDWDIILLGCTHVKTPDVVAPGWLQVRGFWGTHAYVVRQQAYKFLLRELRKPLDPGFEAGIDNVISRLSDQLRIYAIYPNLAWQRGSMSDFTGTYREMFDEQGRQKRFLRIIEKIEQSMARITRKETNAAG